MAEHRNEVPADDMSSFGVSDDLQFVQIKMGAGPDGAATYLTMASANVMPFIDALSQLQAHLVAIKAVPAPPLNQPRSVGAWKIGRSSLVGAEKLTIFVFDEGSPKEVVLLMADIDALKLADAIEKQVFKKLSVVDQRNLIKQVEDARGGSKLILPPRRN